MSSLKNPVEGKILVRPNIGPDLLRTVYCRVTVMQRLPWQAQEFAKTKPSVMHHQIRDSEATRPDFCNDDYRNGLRKIS